MKPIRTFFALPLDKKTKLAIINVISQLKKDPQAENVRWIKPENLHITIKFLGNIRLEDCNSLVEDFKHINRTNQKFSLKLTKLDYLPSEKRPRIISIATEESDDLKNLFNQLEQCGIEFGITKETRQFRPHLTIGRVHKQKKITFNFDVYFHEIIVPVNEIILFQSNDDDGGVYYTPIAKINLL